MNIIYLYFEGRVIIVAKTKMKTKPKKVLEIKYYIKIKY